MGNSKNVKTHLLWVKILINKFALQIARLFWKHSGKNWKWTETQFSKKQAFRFLYINNQELCRSCRYLERRKLLLGHWEQIRIIKNIAIAKYSNASRICISVWEIMGTTNLSGSILYTFFSLICNLSSVGGPLQERDR